MTGFICKSGLLSIILVVVESLTALAAPLAQGEGIRTGQTRPEAFRACKNIEISTYAVTMDSWEEVCRPTLSTNTRSEVGLRLYHSAVVWGDTFSHAQLKVDDSTPCLSRTKSGLSDLKYVCRAVGMPWINSVAGISTISETLQSLYEFVLPEEEFQKETFRGMELSYAGKQFLRYRGTVLSDRSEISTVPQMATIMQLLLSLFPEQGLRNLGLSESSYQIEVYDTLTRFIPILSTQTRRVELGDLLPLLLLLLLLPNYKQLFSGQGILGTGVGGSRRVLSR